MLKSLLNGLSGIKGHQVKMDVIGSNLSNVNTVGYKSAQTTFAETLSNTLSTVQGPSGGKGGINPIQIGLGAGVASVKSSFTQGTLQDTGNDTDLALLGNGFFVVSDGAKNFYTRSGNFNFDADGHLVNSQGFFAQGKQATATGKIPADAVIGKIRLSADAQTPAHATAGVSIAGNLNSEDKVLGTITQTKPLLATATATEDLSGLYANGTAELFLELTSGVDAITVGDQNGTKSFIYGVDFTTIQDLAQAVTTEFAGRFQSAVGADGQVTFTALVADTTLVAQSNTSSALDSAFANVNAAILVNAGDTTDSDQFAHVATGADTLVNLRNVQGDALGLRVGDDITQLSASIGDVSQGSKAILADITANTTLEDFRSSFQTQLFGTSPQPEEKITIETDGRIKIAGGLGTDRKLSGINVGAGVNTNQDTRSVMGESMTFFDTQTAADVEHTMTTTIYDHLGESHTLQVVFTKTREAGTWTWAANLTGNESVRSGGTGITQFDRTGALTSFQYDGGATSFSFDPGNNSKFVELELGVGTEGEFDGITHFASNSTAAVTKQDGYPIGNLEAIDVDESGVIFANFSNGIRQTVAQLGLAQFNNPAGLTKTQNSLFAASVNSGSPVIGEAGKTIRAQIVSKKLEQSNVDIAEEFTRMIMAQRGLQANSKVVTTSADLLNELINLKR